MEQKTQPALFEAASQGYFWEEDVEATAVEMEEPTKLIGDDDKMTDRQKEVVLMLKEASLYPVMKVKRVSLSFSGASVFFATPIRSDGTLMPASVLKLDTEENVKDEIEKTVKYAPLFGLTTPKVKDSRFLPNAKPNEPTSVMQIDLCGGIFGLPEFASAPPVLTFASIIETELKSDDRKVDMIAMLNEAMERRMRAFTMSQRAIQKMDLGKMYKLVRFVGHGVLNRAKEGAKRAAKSPALAHGFQNPVAIDDLDPEGAFLLELSGKRQTIKDFFASFCEREQAFSEKFNLNVVTGLCHNDLHGGNLLLDSQGLVWLIDFATVQDNVHVLMDLSKFLSSVLFLYLKQNVKEENIHTLAKLLLTSPDVTTPLPKLESNMTDCPVSVVIWEMMRRLRYYSCMYESGDDAPRNDGTPFSLALFSWSARMLSYSEPDLFQKTRATYFALAGAYRILWALGEDVGPTATAWIQEYRTLWEGEKGRRLSTGVEGVDAVVEYDFNVEFPKYLAQVGSSEAWCPDFLTREKVHVTDHAIALSVNFAGAVRPRRVILPPATKALIEKMRPVHQKYMPGLLDLDSYYGRLLITGDGGSGKSMLTRQLFSEVSQLQVIQAYEGGIKGGKLVPLRVPVIELARQLEEEPDSSLEADPVNDLLSRWMERKYGDDSIPLKLVTDVRRIPEEGDEPDDDDPASGAQGLLLLLDGLDEASTNRGAVLQYVHSLVTTEPQHIFILTTRPGCIVLSELEMLSDNGFQAFLIGKLDATQGTHIADGMLRRSNTNPAIIQKVCNDVMNPSYGSLVENALSLTLLIHVLRKFHLTKMEELQKSGGDAAQAATKEAPSMYKSEVFQRSAKLILHQSDSAKFAMREGKSDQEMAKRLGLLKSSRARRFFQWLGWEVHCRRQRGVHFSEIEAVTPDKEIFEAWKQACEDGRMQMFQVQESTTGESTVQYVHLSFQELMAAEFLAGAMTHGYKEGTLRGLANMALSTNLKNPTRDRLSEPWWYATLLFAVEMMEPKVFTSFCEVISDDPRAKMAPGMVGFQRCITLGDLIEGLFTGKAPRFPWLLGNGMRVKEVVKTKMGMQMVRCEPVVADCCKSLSHGSELWKKCRKLLSLTRIQWYQKGIAGVLRYAVSENHILLVKELLKNRVHFAITDDFGAHAFSNSFVAGRPQAMALLVAAGADVVPGCMNPLAEAENLYNGRIFANPAYPRILELCTGLSQVRKQKKRWVWGEALKGTLDLTDDRIVLDLQDPDTGATALMMAAAGGHASLLKDIMDMKASIDLLCKEECTALTYATECATGPGALECMRLLIEAKSDVNHRAGKSKMRDWFYCQGHPNSMGVFPCMEGDLDKLKLLLDNGFDPLLPNEYGFNCLRAACMAGHPHLIEAMLEYDPQIFQHDAEQVPEKPRPNDAFWPQDIANETCLWNPTEAVLRLFFKHGVDMNKVSVRDGMKVVPWVCLCQSDYQLHVNDSTRNFQVFIENGIDINEPQPSQLGNSLFHMTSAFSRSGALAKFMFEAGADLETRLKFPPHHPTPRQFWLQVKNQAVEDAYQEWMETKKLRAANPAEAAACEEEV